MSPSLHPYCRALLAGMAFCISLIMTPRVWVEAPADTSDPKVPINQLEQGTDCLWCDDDRRRQDCDYDRYFLFDSDNSSDDCDEHDGPHA